MIAALLLACGVPFLACAVRAQTAVSPEEFYRGRDIHLYIGTGPGGTYDLYSRLLARHLSKYLPGRPTVVPVNMEGAGSLRLANWLYNAAPRDGTAIGLANRGTLFEPLLGHTGAALFDTTRYTWIGSPTGDMSVCVVARDSGLTHFEQLFERTIFVGSTGGGSGSDVFPRILNSVLGTRMRIVSGYIGGNDIDFAMERGEVDGRCGWSWASVVATKGDWLEDGRIRVILQLSVERNPDLPRVPNVMEYAETEEDARILRLIFARDQLGYPFMAPPGVPADRAAALRAAFLETMRDPELLAEAARMRAPIAPLSGEEIAALIAQLFATPRPLVERTRAYLGVRSQKGRQ